MTQVNALLHAVATKAYFLGDDKMGEFLEVFSSYFGTSLQCFCFEHLASLASYPGIYCPDCSVELTHSSLSYERRCSLLCLRFLKLQQWTFKELITETPLSSYNLSLHLRNLKKITTVLWLGRNWPV